MGSPRRYELTDFEWSIIEPLLPNKPRGMPRADDRMMLSGIYWGCAPARRGRTSPTAKARPPPATTASSDGGSSAPGPHLRGGVEGLRRRYPDGRFHHHPRPPARCERQKRGLFPPLAAGNIPGPRCLGRSRGGLTTKIHAWVDADGLPIALQLSPGQGQDGRAPATFWARSPPASCFSPTPAATATPCARRSPPAVLGLRQAEAEPQAAPGLQPPSSAASATSSSASSTSS